MYLVSTWENHHCGKKSNGTCFRLGDFQQKNISPRTYPIQDLGASHEKGRSTTLQHFLQHPSYHLITQSTTQRHNLQRISTNLNYTCFLAKLATNCNLLAAEFQWKLDFFQDHPPPPKKTKKTNKQVFQTPGFDWLKGTWYFMMLALEPPPWRANTSNKKRNEAKKKRLNIQKSRSWWSITLKNYLNISK